MAAMFDNDSVDEEKLKEMLSLQLTELGMLLRCAWFIYKYY